MNNRSVLTVIVLLLALALLALGLRLYRLDAQSLWYDEGFSVYLARMDLAEITTRTAADIQPPLYYYLLHGWIQWVGDDEWGARSLSAFLGVLAVPLLFGLGWQLFRNHLSGFLAAFLLAISPLHVWYGQEARMYTLLVFLSLLSSTLLLLIVERARSAPTRAPVGGADEAGLWGRLASIQWLVPALWVIYTLVNVAAVYTHYFAFFVMAFQMVYLLLVWGADTLQATASPASPSVPGGHWWAHAGLLVGGFFSGLFTLLAYVPWLPHLLARYGQDASFWPGELKLAEVLVDIAVLFVGGESVAESTGVLLAIGFGALLLLCLLALAASARRQAPNGDERAPYPLAFLLLFLFLPPLLILLLSYNTPKFNARYVLIAQPAMILLLAGGLAELWGRRKSYVGNVAREALVVLGLLFMVGVAAYANFQAYTNPDFARADFRSVAHYVRKNLEPDETVILTSGHMFPVFDYYAPGMERHLLPDSPTLDTTKVLDYRVASQLTEWLQDRGGVWLVLWQDEVVDPAGFLTTMLDEVGEAQPVTRTFPKIEVRHYRLPADVAFALEPEIAHPADFNFGNKLHLLGYTQTGERQVTLFWKALQPLTEDYRVSVVLRDTLGQSWGSWDGRPTAYYFPTNRWPVGEIIFGRYDLRLLPGSPPGDYGFEVGVYTEEDPVGLDVLDQAGAAQGKRAMLGAVRLAVSAVKPEDLELSATDGVPLGSGLRCLDWELGRQEVQPGDRVLLVLAWFAESQPPADYSARLVVVDAESQAWNAGGFALTTAWHPTSTWLPGQAWRGQMTFRVPIQARPGQATLALQLVDATGQAVGELVHLTTLEVLPTERNFTPPNPQAPRSTNFADQLALLGADLLPENVAPGGALQVALYWQAWVEMDVSYTTFVHLLGPDGQVVVGQDSQPAGGSRPTTGWVPGEYITDVHTLVIPTDLPPGEYIVEAGMYDAGLTGLPRLPVLDANGLAQTDRVIFGPIRVQ